MRSAISLARGKASELASATTNKIRRDGVLSFLKASADNLCYLSTIISFKILFDSVTRDELIRRAKQSDRYWEYGSAEKVEIQNQEIGRTPDLFTEHSGLYDVERPFVCELDGGYLINSTHPFALTRDREVIMESEKPTYGPRKNATQPDTPFHSRIEYTEGASSRMRQLCRGYARSQGWFHERTQFETVFPLTFGGDNSYYHWLLDKLPTVRGLRRYEEVTGREPTVVVDSNLPGWIQETLSLVGVDNVVPLDMPVVKADRLVVSSCRESVPRNQLVYEPSREDITWLNREMKSRAPSTSTEQPDRIYISRKNVSNRGRNVTNQEELESVLEEFNVETCSPETLSVAEQIRLFENADLLMGPHGAGLTNMIFSEDTCVIELLNKEYPTFQHLSQLCGHEYQYLRCGVGGGHRSSIEVDTADLRDTLASFDGLTTSSP